MALGTLLKKTRPHWLVFLWLCTVPSLTQADTISWWRFESGEDLDPSAAGLENPNEVSGEPAMISDNAVLGTNAPDLFAEFVPGPGVPNTGSVRSFVNGDGGDGIYGSAAYSATLDVDSITVEFWVRTTENEAGFVARTTDPDQGGEGGDLDNGFRIVEPQNVRVDYWVSRTNGTDAEMETITSNIAINDGEWHYIAFTYNAGTRVGTLTIDETTFTVDNGGGTRRLWWGAGNPEPEVTIGYRLDGNPNNNTGTLDEIRFSDEALDPEDLLIGVVPEASTWWGLAALVLGLAPAALRRHFRRVRS